MPVPELAQLMPEIVTRIMENVFFMAGIGFVAMVVASTLPARKEQ